MLKNNLKNNESKNEYTKIFKNLLREYNELSFIEDKENIKELISIFGVIEFILSNSNQDIYNSFVKYIEKGFVIFSTFLSSISVNDRLYEIDFILKYISRNNVGKVLKNAFNDILFIVDESKKENMNIDGLIISAKNIVVALTGRKLNSIKSIIAAWYGLDFDSAVKSISSIIGGISRCIQYFFGDTAMNEITNILSFINEFNKDMNIVAEILWPISSLSILLSENYATYAIFSVISILINGPNFNSGNALENFAQFSISLVFGVVNVILSPFSGVAELAIYCSENNISFWEWCNAHWECIKDNWILALDPLNVFHSCIRNLVKYS